MSFNDRMVSVITIKVISMTKRRIKKYTLGVNEKQNDLDMIVQRVSEKRNWRMSNSILKQDIRR